MGAISTVLSISMVLRTKTILVKFVTWKLILVIGVMLAKDMHAGMGMRVRLGLVVRRVVELAGYSMSLGLRLVICAEHVIHRNLGGHRRMSVLFA